MRPRGLFRGAIAGMLMGIGIAAAFGWTATSRVMAEAATPANTILVIDGQVPGGRPAAFDLEALKKLPVTRVATMTPWTDGENLYDGIRLRDLLRRLGAQGTTVVAEAMDDYQNAIPMEDAEKYDVIVAYAKNGQPLPRDDKGPLWIIYPFSQFPELQKDLFFSRSVWQLKRLTVQ
jgi:hypothetical protein